MTARSTPIILFVNRFDRCLTFYQQVFGLKVLRLYRGPEHPDWAELKVGDTRFCLHGKYRRASHYRPGRPLTLHLDVKDM